MHLVEREDHREECVVGSVCIRAGCVHARSGRTAVVTVGDVQVPDRGQRLRQRGDVLRVLDHPERVPDAVTGDEVDLRLACGHTCDHRRDVG